MKKTKILFIPCYYYPKRKITLPSSLREKIKKYSKLGLFTTAQHLNLINEIKNELERKFKKEVIIGGQILGCSLKKIKRIEKRVDAFLYFGSGKFHPLNIALNTNKPVFIFNPYSNTFSKISNKEKVIYTKKRRAAFLKFLEGEKFGILISTKTGQFNLKKAKEIKKELKRKKENAKVFLFVGEEISPEKLIGFDVDVWINTACPRIIEDHFDKPILNFEEIEKAKLL